MRRLCLRPSQRILKRHDYLRIQRAGTRFYTPEIVFVYLALADGASRLGIAVSRKTMRRSVWRNRFKRLVRETFRLRQHEFPAPVEVVAIARDASLQATFEDVNRSFTRFMKFLAQKTGRGEGAEA